MSRYGFSPRSISAAGHDMLLILEQIGARHPLGGELAGRAEVRVRGERIDDVAQRRAESRAHRGRVADQRAQEQRRDDRTNASGAHGEWRMSYALKLDCSASPSGASAKHSRRRQAGVAPDRDDRDAEREKTISADSSSTCSTDRGKQIEQREIDRRQHRQQDQIVTREVRVDLAHRQRHGQHDRRRDQHPRQAARR